MSAASLTPTAPHASTAAVKIARMANQIALFMETRPEAEAAAGLAAHLNDYWEPRMRRQFFDLVDAGGEGLRPLVLKAAAEVRRP